MGLVEMLEMDAEASTLMAMWGVGASVAKGRQTIERRALRNADPETLRIEDGETKRIAFLGTDGPVEKGATVRIGRERFVVTDKPVWKHGLIHTVVKREEPV